MILLAGDCLQVFAGLGHERAAIGDLGQGVYVGLVQQQFGGDVGVELGLAQREEAVEGQCAEEHRVAEGHGALEGEQFDIGVVERIENHPGNHLRTVERPAAQGHH
ncbi:hypothetical protein D3C84_1095470 [compost metagenome]